ncbi:hypothetical protein [Actinoplanes sp. NPDC020271]|uniref:hypothetical protein n=1 Tax=Actinoplanes sp. NPDC020271 TaxID=3363896 RepID=UPI0037AC5DB3
MGLPRPHQADLDAGLREAHRRELAHDSAYWWKQIRDGSAEPIPDRPPTIGELFESEYMQETGTHSILDMDEVLPPGSAFRFGGVLPLTEAEAIEETGVATLTVEHIPMLARVLPEQRWGGRCAVLHDDAGNPSEIYFWGVSGD